MKKLLFILSILFTFSVCAFADEPIEFTQNPDAHYRLFRTQNFWIFLRLDTATGKIDLVQYSVQDSSKAGIFEFSDYSLLKNGEKAIPGRFTLYSTQNMYNYLLLDTYTGSTYQVQWDLKPENCFVRLIY